MSSTAHISPGILAGLADGCARLVAPRVAGDERRTQARFIAVALAAPFVLSAAWPAVYGVGLGDSLVLATVAIAFAASWISVAVTSATGRMDAAAPAALAAATTCIAVTLAAAGGLASPALLCLLALAFEPWWICRSRNALLAGGAAAVAALLAQPFLPGSAPAGFAAWHWLLPLGYAALALPRLYRALGSQPASAEPGAAVLEDVIDAVVVRLTANGDVLDATRQSERMLGVAPALLLGDGLFERVHIADRIAYLSALADLRVGGPSGRMELRLRAATDGDHASYRLFAAEYHAGEPAILVLRRLAEVEALRREVAEARDQADRVEVAKSRFLAAVSHELRTPLNAIIGFSDMLAHEMAGPFTDPRQRDYSGLIRDAGTHLLEVVNSILDVSKIEAGAYPIRPEPFRFDEAAASCHAMMALLATRRGVRLDNEVTQAAGEVNCDRRAVQQILINLLSNAIKFTPEGGSVSLSARRHGRQLVIEVADTGIGIADEDLARLGRPFEQVDSTYTRQFDGAGLGLSIANGLVALHGGALSIASAPGDGTTVTVTLPVDGPAGIAGRPASMTTEERHHVPFRKSA